MYKLIAKVLANQLKVVLHKCISDKYVALKLDNNKSYDRMDWYYLKEVMIKMDFSQKWNQWMVMCIESIDYSVLVNGEHVGPVIPGRGLRQGDPLSLSFYHLCRSSLFSH